VNYLISDIQILSENGNVLGSLYYRCRKIITLSTSLLFFFQNARITQVVDVGLINNNKKNISHGECSFFISLLIIIRK